ncbi:adenosine receptor A2a-like [Latimeria chalumnae]|uniref:adenosine receptor A2a-like n=1 Tax=Latimeria chalumnae TaxID=7897 RepID=UPI00313D4278
MLTLVGNGFICIAVLKSKKLRLVTNYFLVSLALADFLVGAVAIPCALLTDLGLPRCKYFLCVLMLCTLLILTQASIFGLLAIAVERYIAVLEPFYYQSIMTPRNSALIILASWVLSIFIGLVPLIGWRKPIPDDGWCIFDNIIDATYMVYFNFICCMLVPLVIMFVIYGRIFTEVKKQIRQIAERQVDISAQEKRRKVIRKEFQTAISLFLVLFFFALCWIPIHILNCITLYCPGCTILDPIMQTTVIFSHANSAVNPFIYVFRMKSFREAFEGMFSWLWHPVTVTRCSHSELAPYNKGNVDVGEKNKNISLPGI